MQSVILRLRPNILSLVFKTSDRKTQAIEKHTGGTSWVRKTKKKLKKKQKKQALIIPADTRKPDDTAADETKESDFLSQKNEPENTSEEKNQSEGLEGRNTPSAGSDRTDSGDTEEETEASADSPKKSREETAYGLFLDGKTYEEIADTMGVKLSTAKAYVYGYRYKTKTRNRAMILAKEETKSAVGQTRDQKFTFRATAAEMDVLRAKAKLEGKPLGTWIVETCLLRRVKGYTKA